MEFPSKLMKLMKMTVQNTRAVVERVHGKIENFHIISVRGECDSVSILLFNIFIEIKIRQIDTRGSIRTKPTQQLHKRTIWPLYLEQQIT